MVWCVYLLVHLNRQLTDQRLGDVYRDSFSVGTVSVPAIDFVAITSKSEQ